MKSETKVCQNCKNEFVIEPEDFEFYARMKVPPPTFCPECRFQRRLMFRNFFKFYKRKCDLCGKDIVAIFSPDKPFKVYCNPCWWSDKWDGLEFGQEYDPKRNFFEQFRELQLKAPYPALFVDYSTLVNSEYTNHVGYAKNSYLLFDADHNENLYYTVTADYSKDSMDCYFIGENELCYWNINCEKVFKTHFSEDVEGCHDIYFCRDMTGCSDCFGCAGLRRKQYHIFNQPYNKEEYFKKLSEFKISSYSELEKIKKQVHEFWASRPQKFMHETMNVNVSGDYIYYSKNVRDSYMVVGGEDCRYCQFIKTPPAKDCYDYGDWGNDVQQIYECLTVGEGVANVRFSFGCVLAGTLDNEYSMFCGFDQHIFGCAGLLKKSYCILNKQYSKENYLKLRSRIVEDMNKNPYVDSKDRVFKYGEFFPYNFSFFGYNESSAHQYFPLVKKEVLDRGWSWKDEEPPKYHITKKAEELPDDIKDASEDILKEIIGCLECGRGFRIIAKEMKYLRDWGFPLPRKCFECRHRERLSRMNLPRFYKRKCAKCDRELISTFSPQKPEVIYCEACYNTEIV